MRYNIQTGLGLIWQRLEKAEGNIIIVISGFTCSGKTFLAQQLMERLDQAGLSFSQAPLDPFFLDWDDPDLPINDQGQLVFDLPNSYAQTEYVQAVRDLATGQSIWLPDYDMASNRRISSKGKLIRPQPLIIAEGLYAIRFLQGQHLNLLKVFVEADLLKTCLPRRIARDTRLYGVSAEKVQRVFLAKVVPASLEHIAPQIEIADIIITNNKGGG